MLLGISQLHQIDVQPDPGDLHRSLVDQQRVMVHPLVTLNKSETFSSPTGQRTIHHAARGSRVLLFVREHRRQGTVTEPFRCLGFVSYESHDGERPMAIRWRLEREIPAVWLQGMALAV